MGFFVLVQTPVIADYRALISFGSDAILKKIFKCVILTGPSVLETYDEPNLSAKGTLIWIGIIYLVLVRDILIFVDLKKVYKHSGD